MQLNDFALNQAAATLAEQLNKGTNIRTQKMYNDYAQQQALQRLQLQQQYQQELQNQKLATQRAIELWKEQQAWQRHKDEQTFKERMEETKFKHAKKLKQIPTYKLMDSFTKAYRLIESGRRLINTASGNSMFGIGEDPVLKQEGLRQYYEGRALLEKQLGNKKKYKEYMEKAKGLKLTPNPNPNPGLGQQPNTDNNPFAEFGGMFFNPDSIR